MTTADFAEAHKELKDDIKGCGRKIATLAGVTYGSYRSILHSPSRASEYCRERIIAAMESVRDSEVSSQAAKLAHIRGQSQCRV